MLYRRFLWKILVVLALALLAVGTVYAIEGSTTLSGYTIDLVEVTEDTANNQSTWVYAITADYGVPANGLSHWSLGIGSCYEVVEPPVGSIYTTPITNYGCGDVYTCSQGSYTVYYDAGMSSTVTDGIKFETYDSDNELGPDNLTTQIFEVTVQKESDQIFRRGDTYVDVKPGDTLYTGEVVGPVCEPNAVTIAGLDARGRPEYWTVTGFAGMVVFVLVWRRRSWHDRR